MIAEPAKPTEHDPVRIASLLLTSAVQTLVYIGGKEATIDTLQGVIARIRAGAYPEPIHPAGNA